LIPTSTRGSFRSWKPKRRVSRIRISAERASRAFFLGYSRPIGCLCLKGL
jgi:hypothetical protein